MTAEPSSNTSFDLREYDTRKQTAAELGVTERTVIRYEIDHGLPVIAVGRMRLHHRPTKREWLLKHQTVRHQPRQPGRPSCK